MFMSLMLGAAVAAAKPQTIGYEEIVMLSEHADLICPMLIDQKLSDKERGDRLMQFAKARGYKGAGLSMLGVICTQWQKGYIAGAKQGSIN